MKVLIYIVGLIALSTIIIAQDKVVSKQEQLVKGGQIIAEARVATGLNKTDLSSFVLKTKTVFNGEFSNNIQYRTDESKVLLPNKIHALQTLKTKIGVSATTRVWNADKQKAISDVEFMGRRVVKDISESDSGNKNVEKLKSNIGKEKAEKIQGFISKSPKERFNEYLWRVLFPIILEHPFEKKLEYEFVGKAKSAKRVANVVDVRSKSGKKYRLLIDSKSKLVLMLIETFSTKKGDIENRFFYTEREIINGISIPKKIKIEEKFVPTGEEPRISFVNISVDDFRLNPEISERVFDVE